MTNNSIRKKDDFSENHNDIKSVLIKNNDTNKNDDYHKYFTDMSDEQIVMLAKEYDVDALDYILSKYKGLVHLKSASYFLIGADKDDIVQEGMIGLYKAIRDFNPDKLTSFKGFAELCITRQIISAIKAATRQKHQPLNSYISLNKPVYEDESERTLLDLLIANDITNPEDIIVSKEGLDSLEKKINEFLSKLEMQVLSSYVDGKSYVEIANELSRDVKSVDNALQRIKAKIERYLEDGRTNLK